MQHLVSWLHKRKTPFKVFYSDRRKQHHPCFDSSLPPAGLPSLHCPSVGARSDPGCSKQWGLMSGWVCLPPGRSSHFLLWKASRPSQLSVQSEAHLPHLYPSSTLFFFSKMWWIAFKGTPSCIKVGSSGLPLGDRNIRLNAGVNNEWKLIITSYDNSSSQQWVMFQKTNVSPPLI